MIYTTVEKVISVLSASNGKRVRTSSNALKTVKSGTVVGNLAGAINTWRVEPSGQTIVTKSLIEVGSSYVGNDEFRIQFTSATEYGVWAFRDGSFSLLGSGDINTDHQILDTVITLAAGCFSGAISSAAQVNLQFEADISDDQVSEYIKQTEYLIDNVLSENMVGYSTDGSSLIFEDEVPEQIKTATAYLTAFYIYTDVFADVQADIAEKEYSYAFRWRKRAEDIITTFSKWRTRETPRVVSFPMIVTQIGIEETGNGPQQETEDFTTIIAGSGVEDVIDPKVP